MSDAPIKTLWDNDRAMREIEHLRQQLAATETRLEGVKQQRDTERTSYLNEFEKNKSLEQQLADHIKREVRLRDALSLAYLNEGGYHEWKETVSAALAATADLKYVILCDAMPITWYDPMAKQFQLGTTPLYRAWEPK